MTDYLVGTGGWAYFDAPGRSHLKAYSEVFNFVEVNSTFYEYPDAKTVERWRRTVPENFVFAVRCHQDLTHRIGLKPVDEAYAVFGQALAYCRILEAPFLVLETPSRYVIDQENVERARNFLSSLNLRGVRLVWEIRALITPEAIDLMRDLNIVQSVDLSREEPSFHSDAIYSRLFGKGKHNIYQFTDEELGEIDRKIAGGKTRIAALSFHGIRMNADAARFMQYKKTGKFIPVTPYAGIESAKAVLSEDARFPASKKGLIEQQGWKVVDLTPDKRVHLSEVLVNLPEKTYRDLNEVVKALGARN